MTITVEALQGSLRDFKDVTVEDEGEYLTVRMPYIPGEEGKDKWNRINDALRPYSGLWISNGKWSHWRIKKAQPTPTSDDPYTRMDNAIKSLVQAWQEINK